MNLSFLLLPENVMPRADAIIDAAKDLGVELELIKSKEKDILSFNAELGTFMVSLMPARHPDADTMASGPFSPSKEELDESPAHIIAVLQGDEGTLRDRDKEMATLTAALALATKAIAVMLGHGVCFHRTAPFVTAVAECAEDELPIPGCIDFTLAAEDDDRASILSHGLARYDREELYLTTEADDDKLGEALDLASAIAATMLRSDVEYKTGDTIGRSASEKITVQRVKSPIGKNAQVIWLDLG